MTGMHRADPGFVQRALDDADASSYPRLLASIAAVLDGGHGRQLDAAMAVEGAYLAGLAAGRAGREVAGAPTVFSVTDMADECASAFVAVARFWQAASPDDGEARLAMAAETTHCGTAYRIVEPPSLTRVRWTSAQVDPLVESGLLVADGAGALTLTVRGRFLAARGWSSTAFPATEDRTSRRDAGAGPRCGGTTAEGVALAGDPT